MQKKQRIIIILILCSILAFVFFHFSHYFHGIALNPQSHILINDTNVSIGVGYGETKTFVKDASGKGFAVRYTSNQKRNLQYTIDVYIDENITQVPFEFLYESACFYSPCR